MRARRAAPPDFRYVLLSPRRSSAATLAVGAAAGATTWGVCISSLGEVVGSTVMLAGLGLAGAAYLVGDRRKSVLSLFRRQRAHEVSMAIVPWGIVVEPDEPTRVLRWAAVRDIRVDVRHILRAGTPLAVGSIVTVETERERFAGHAHGAVGLEGLTVNVNAYAQEAAMPIAADLDGVSPLVVDWGEPEVECLLQLAHEHCSSARGAQRLGLPMASYRDLSLLAPSIATIKRLELALDPPDLSELDADPRALAAVLAAELGVNEVLPSLLRLVSSPHPLVAAIAKAAALRLGAPLGRAGSVDEVAMFIHDADFHRLIEWVCEPLATSGTREVVVREETGTSSAA